MIDFIYFLSTCTNDTRYENCKNQIKFLNENNIYNCKIFHNVKFPDTFAWQLVQNLKMSIGALSCLYGHYQILKNAIFNNYECVCVCEDDICINEEFISLYKNFDKFADFNFDCLRLFHFKDDNLEKKYKNKYFFKNRNNYKLWSSACYIMKKNMMIDYINWMDNYVSTCDNYFNMYDKSKYDLYETDYLFVKIQNYETIIQ